MNLDKPGAFGNFNNVSSISTPNAVHQNELFQSESGGMSMKS
jgi:hypothetical protein